MPSYHSNGSNDERKLPQAHHHINKVRASDSNIAQV